MSEFRRDRILGKYGTISNDGLKTHVIVRISYNGTSVMHSCALHKRGSNKINSIKLFSRPYNTNIQQGIEIDIDKKRTYWKTTHTYDIELSDYIIPKNIFPSDFDAILKDKLESLNIDYGPHYKF